MRKWLATARDITGRFIDQRRIEGASQYEAERDSFDWIRRQDGAYVGKSTVKEIEE